MVGKGVGLNWKRGVGIILLGMLFMVLISLQVSAASCATEKQIKCDNGLIVCPNDQESVPNCVISTIQTINTDEFDVYYFGELTLKPGISLFVKSFLSHEACDGCTRGSPEKTENWGGYGGYGGDLFRKGESGHSGSTGCGDQAGGAGGAGGWYAGGYLEINANKFFMYGRIVADGAYGNNGGNAIKYGCGVYDDQASGAGGGGAGSGAGTIIIDVVLFDQNGGTIQAKGGNGGAGGRGEYSDNENGGGAGGGGAG